VNTRRPHFRSKRVNSAKKLLGKARYRRARRPLTWYISARAHAGREAGRRGRAAVVGQRWWCWGKRRQACEYASTSTSSASCRRAITHRAKERLRAGGASIEVASLQATPAACGWAGSRAPTKARGEYRAAHTHTHTSHHITRFPPQRTSK